MRATVLYIRPKDVAGGEIIYLYAPWDGISHSEVCTRNHHWLNGKRIDNKVIAGPVYVRFPDNRRLLDYQNSDLSYVSCAGGSVLGGRYSPRVILTKILHRFLSCEFDVLKSSF